MKNELLIIWMCLAMTSLFAQQEIRLYQGQIPNARNVPDPEQIRDRGPNNRAFADTAVPTLTIHRPEEPNGTAIIVCPGGGYAYTAFDKEETLVAKELIEKGYTAFVLKYRIPQDLTNIDKSLAPLQDAQQAIRYVRNNASRYQLEPDQIGIMGFSAGGHLASSAATHFDHIADANNQDTTSVKPDFVALIYPVISMTDSLTHMGSRNNLIGEDPKASQISIWSNDQQVTTDSPPAFLIHAGDDRAVPVGNSLAYYQACLHHEVPAEMHLYPGGGHGFGLYNPTTTDLWIDHLFHWLSSLD